MKWTITYDDVEKMVTLKTEGVFDKQSNLEQRKDLIEAVKKHNPRACLLDHSLITSVEVTALDIFEMPRAYAEAGVAGTFRLAVVGPESFRKTGEFFETVSRNFGYTVSLFGDIDSAKKWLKGE